jgi:hypothetical protein
MWLPQRLRKVRAHSDQEAVDHRLVIREQESVLRLSHVLPPNDSRPVQHKEVDPKHQNAAVGDNVRRHREKKPEQPTTARSAHLFSPTAFHTIARARRITVFSSSGWLGLYVHAVDTAS